MKKYIDDFYQRVSQNRKPWSVYSITTNVTDYQNLHNTSESFFKSNYDLIHSEIDVLAALYFNDINHSLTPTELYDATIFSSGGNDKSFKNLKKENL